MELLNLTLGQFLLLFGSVSAISVALYLLDRTRRKQIVPTLRFWVSPGQPAPVSRRRRIQQPLSLLLQILGMAFLLLALAEFQFGGALNKRRDHVLILDTSAWMGAGLPNRPGATLMDLARANAIAWLRAVPSSDRVLLVRADGLATPATSWETDHRKIARAILESQPGATALNLSQNIEFARDLQRQSGAASGEIVYTGPGRIAAREANNLSLPQLPAFRVLPVDDLVENYGIRSVGARRSQTDSGAWDVLVRLRNYGRRPRTVNVTLNFGKAPQGFHPVELPPGEEKETTFTVHTLAAGILEARLYPKDAFDADNYAALELPSQRTLHVIVYSDQPDLIRPALTSDPRVRADFRPTSQYTPANDGLVMLDRFHPETRPSGSTLWIDPPDTKPPIPIRKRVEHPEGVKWVPDQPITQGLRARNAQIESASVFESGPGEIRIAEVDEGPVAIARGNMVVIGFNPFAGSMRYELATPLLLANILRYIAPDVFRDIDVGTQSAGAVAAPLPQQADHKTVQVITDSGAALPFNIRDRSVQFFAGEPARVRVLAGNTERVYSLTLPEMWDAKWNPPANARHGIPSLTDSLRRTRDIWPWLALLGAGLLLTEWIVYGSAGSRLHIVRSRGGRHIAEATPAEATP
ncbi:MAG TPA: BatA and WFA domain-containing protein [Bryobacteraceae bacterium]|nr:BatA and WFA domain-containing protein [Bryobacteraceae bacterium]